MRIGSSAAISGAARTGAVRGSLSRDQCGRAVRHSKTGGGVCCSSAGLRSVVHCGSEEWCSAVRCDCVGGTEGTTKRLGSKEGALPGLSPRGAASFTRMVRPMNSTLFSSLAAAMAALVSRVTKPKPRDRPVSRSEATKASSTCPNLLNSWSRSSRRVSQDKLPMYNCDHGKRRQGEEKPFSQRGSSKKQAAGLHRLQGSRSAYAQGQSLRMAATTCLGG